MTIETVINKIDNLDHTLRELAKAVSESNHTTLLFITITLTIFAVAIIASQAIYIKIIKKMQKQLLQQSKEIEDLRTKEKE